MSHSFAGKERIIAAVLLPCQILPARATLVASMSSEEGSSPGRKAAERAPLKSATQSLSKASAKTPVKSQKLGRTLQELETAFHDWQSLSAAKTKAKVEDENRKETSQSEKEFRKKTKKLLNQLRQQLAELND